MEIYDFERLSNKLIKEKCMYKDNKDVKKKD
jgi:hypothetical protein